jgi:hypothetical protein
MSGSKQHTNADKRANRKVEAGRATLEGCADANRPQPRGLWRRTRDILMETIA